MVGNFVGTTALAAVGIGFPVIYLLSSLFMGLSIGGSVVIAQFMGAGDREAVRRSVNTVYGAVMVSVVPLTLFGVLIAGPILHLIRVPADVYDQAHVYLQVIFAGIIGSLGYNINAGILQGLGDSKTPLLFLATACVVNIVLDLVFVLVFDWGVFGVAFATIIAQLCSWIFGVCYVNRKYDFIAIRPLHISVDNVLLKRVLKLGVPSGIQQCQFSVAILVLQALINGFGAEFAAGFRRPTRWIPLLLCLWTASVWLLRPMWDRTWAPVGWTVCGRGCARRSFCAWESALSCRYWSCSMRNV